MICSEYPKCKRPDSGCSCLDFQKRMQQEAQLYAGTEIERSIEARIAETASDYKMAYANDGFAAENGGVDKLRDDLFALIVEWEGEIDDADV